MRLVPKSELRRADVERLAAQLEWDYHQTKQSEGQTPFEITWLAPDRGAAVRWLEDPLIGVDYFVVQGPDIDPTLKELMARLDFHSTESLHDLFDATRDGSAVMDALHVLGVHSSGEFDPDLFALFRWSLNDPDSLVRRVALLMVSLTSWSEFIPLLDYLRRHDSVASVRAQAETIHDVMSARLEAG